MAIAKKLGWFNLYVLKEDHFSEKAGTLVGSFRTCGADANLIPVPHYATDIKAAWELTNHMPAFRIEKTSRGWLATFRQNPGPGHFVYPRGEDEVAPLAICLAFLK